MSHRLSTMGVMDTDEIEYLRRRMEDIIQYQAACPRKFARSAVVAVINLLRDEHVLPPKEETLDLRPAAGVSAHHVEQIREGDA